MKIRVLYIICVMMFALVASSCSEGMDVVDGYVDVEITTAIESEYASRATDGFDVDDNDYDMRYTIELWSDDYPDAIYCAEEIVYDSPYNLTHSFRAVAGDYQLVIFADYVMTNDNGEVSESHYTTSEGLNKITISESDDAYKYEANDSSRDCYGYSEDLEITSSFSLSGIILTRPMAKMTLADIDPTNVTTESAVLISYGEGVSLPYGYDLLNGDILTGETVTVTYPSTSEDNQTMIAYDYIFISDPTNYLMTFKVGDKEVSSTVDFEQNRTTNITATFFEDKDNE